MKRLDRRGPTAPLYSFSYGDLKLTNYGRRSVDFVRQRKR